MSGLYRDAIFDDLALAQSQLAAQAREIAALGMLLKEWLSPARMDDLRARTVAALEMSGGVK